MRERGARPPGFIVATEDARIARNARNRGLYSLVFDPEKPQDWRSIHGLWVGLITYLPREKVSHVCQAILEAEPSMFGATYYGKHDIEHDRILSATRQG